MSALHGEESCLTFDHLPPQYGDRAASANADFADPVTSERDALYLKLLSALETSKGNMKRAAEIVGIERTKAYRILKEHPDAELAKLRRKVKRD